MRENTDEKNSEYGQFLRSKPDDGYMVQLGTIHRWRPWKLSNFQDPLTPVSIYFQNFSTPLTMDVQF